MSDSTRRAVRTALDLILGILGSLAAVLLVPGIDEVFRSIGLGEKLTLFSVIVLALTTFFNKLKNALEDIGKIPAVLKAPASGGADPIPDPGEQGSGDGLNGEESPE